MNNEKSKKIFVDIDGTICTITPDNDYTLAKPFPERIAEINRLYEEGNEITYWTARGTNSGKNWERLTIEQLEDWGAKYTFLLVGQKPHFDVYICDKSFNSDAYFRQQEYHVTHITYGDSDYGFHL